MHTSQTLSRASPHRQQVILGDGVFGVFKVISRQLFKMHSSFKGDWGIWKTDVLPEEFLESVILET